MIRWLRRRRLLAAMRRMDLRRGRRQLAIDRRTLARDARALPGA